MNQDILGAIVSAATTLLATLLGGFIAYKAALGSARSERELRRAAIATGVLWELDNNRTALYGLMNARENKVGKIETKMHELFLNEIALFSPQTVQAVLAARMLLDTSYQLKDVSDSLAQADKTKDYSSQVLGDAVSAAHLSMPFLKEAEASLLRDGAIPFTLSAPDSKHLHASDKQMSKTTRSRLKNFLPPDTPE